MRSPATAVKCEPRAHHFAPQCWLAGFTDTGEKDGRLWVTDFKRRKQWPSNPENTGHRRDFYRVSDGTFEDPTAFEKLFSRVEGLIAPLFKAMDRPPRGPYRHEWESLFTYMAIQWMRVPAFRPTLLRVADRIHRELFAEALKTPKSWAAWLLNLGIAPDEPGADYEEMVEFERAGQYTLSAEPEWFLLEGFKAMEGVITCLAERYWSASVSSSGSFIGSDNPVSMDGPIGQEIGFKTAEVVVFPVSRHVFVYGTNLRANAMTTTRKRIAALNTFTMLAANEQVYSHAPDFCWLDEAGRYQTDWRLFSRDKFAQQGGVGGRQL